MFETLTLQRIASSIIGRKIAAEITAGELEERRRLVAERERIRAEGEKRGVEAAKKFYAAEAACKKAEEAFLGARNAENDARAAWSSVNHSAERGIFRIDRELKRTASPRIDELIDWLQRAFQLACNWTPPLSKVPTPFERMFHGAKDPELPPRRPPPTLIVRDAIEAARALKVEAFDAAELDRRIAAIMATVPSEFQDRQRA